MSDTYEAERQAMYARADAREAAAAESDAVWLRERNAQWAESLASRSGIYSAAANGDDGDDGDDDDTDDTDDTEEE